MPEYGRGGMAGKLRNQRRLAAGAVIALFCIAGCGAAAPGGADAAATANQGLGFNGPYGPGGPFERHRPVPAASAGPAGSSGTLLGGTSVPAVSAAAGFANAASGKQETAVRVGGSTALEGARTLPWLTALGPGVSVSAPLSVQPGTDSPADAAAGFYDAFYARRLATACDFVPPAQRAGCPALLRASSGSADTLDSPAIGFVVTKGDEALVTMTGLLCRAAGGCVAQHDAHWSFGMSYAFGTLWSLTARDGGNPLTVTPFRKVAGRWYLALAPSA
jgi:hypothetical protein